MKKLLVIALILFINSILISQVTRTIPQSFSEAKPEAVGMSGERLAKIDKVIEEYVSKNYLPGAVSLVIRKGKIVHYKSYGMSDMEAGKGMKKDDIFRIASQSKAITSLAILLLYEEGRLLLDDPVSKYIPEFKKPKVLVNFFKEDSSYTTEPAKSEITIRQLLTHTSGIDYAEIGSAEMKAIYAKAGIPSGIGSTSFTLKEKIPALGALPLKHHPGEKFTYGLSIDVLGYLVEVLSGKTFDEFLRERIFQPLGMSDTYFYLPKEKHSRLVGLYEDKDGQIGKIKESKDRNPDYPKLNGTYYSGGAGLSSTVLDYAKFLQLFLNNGMFNNKRLLGRKTVELMMKNQITEKQSSSQFGLGFGLETDKNDHISIASDGTFSWGGIFGTTYWADPKEQLIGLLFIQVYPNTHGDIRDKFKVLVYQAIVD